MMARRTYGDQLARNSVDSAPSLSKAYIELGVALRSRLESLLAGLSLPLSGGAGPSAESWGGLEAGGGAEGGAGNDGGHGACVAARMGWMVDDAGCSTSALGVVRCRIEQPTAAKLARLMRQWIEGGLA
jgi:hypothetical protein